MLKDGTLKCENYATQEILKNNAKVFDKVYPGWIQVIQSPNNPEEFLVLVPKRATGEVPSQATPK